MKLKPTLMAICLTLASLASAGALTVSDFNIVTSGTGTNGGLSIAGTVSPVASYRSTGGSWVVCDVGQALLVGSAAQPVLPTAEIQPANPTVLVGQNLLLAAATDGTPPFTYQWRKNGVNLSGQTNLSLSITGVTTNNAGNYAVLVSSPFGSVTSLVSTVTISGVFALLPTASPTLNPLTGLYEEKIAVTNIGGTITGLQLLVGNLPSRVSLYNATGTNNGLPFAQFNVTMTNGSVGTFLLQFFNPYRLNFTNTVQAVAVAAVPPATNNTPGITITKVLMDTSIPGSPRFTLGFTSVAGKSYEVLYSDDTMQTWSVAATLTASANYTLWTELSPSAGSRFFKVLALP